MKPVGSSIPSQPPAIPGTPGNSGVSSTPGNSGQAQQKSVDPEVSKKARESVTQDTSMKIRQQEILNSPLNDVKALVQKAEKTKIDGAGGISQSEYETIKKAYNSHPQSSDTIKWLEKQHPALHAAIVSDLDHGGYTGTANGSLNFTRAGGELKQDAAKRSEKLDQLPPLRDFNANGLPKSVPGGQPLGNDPVSMKPVNAYQTGPNTTKIIGDDLANISDADAEKSRKTQQDFCAKMSGLTGLDVPNPPSTKAARGYFQAMADRGASPDQIKSEYGQYLKTFYRHPGGVDWNPAIDPKTVDSQFAQQPLAKDGKRLVDCEGFSALAENVLGGIKKNGQPMFDIKHAASPGHVVTAIFPHGGDIKKGFIVDNTEVSDVKLDPRQERDFNSSPSQDTKMRFLVRQHMAERNEGTPTEYGNTYTEMKPLTGKTPTK